MYAYICIYRESSWNHQYKHGFVGDDDYAAIVSYGTLKGDRKKGRYDLLMGGNSLETMRWHENGWDLDNLMGFLWQILNCLTFFSISSKLLYDSVKIFPEKILALLFSKGSTAKVNFWKISIDRSPSWGMDFLVNWHFLNA